jgi:hypothetical protein
MSTDPETFATCSIQDGMLQSCTGLSATDETAKRPAKYTRRSAFSDTHLCVALFCPVCLVWHLCLRRRLPTVRNECCTYTKQLSATDVTANRPANGTKRSTLAVSIFMSHCFAL